ncbi:ATP-binding protein [Saccharopolyspora dendranthemae]|uniref:Serine/threonine-protein kinase RsbW n=1 Tax=Saccharopolyspora dendranthemae TaxID=1181886 RepID=A0A561U7E8_9PSEU|nr:ATP-binding protein [Saccharopolyspora dendranthemae]TWF95289.1 serine/threonine-protein kinase RsbW [Saccharopolyspora dendranthemae]
MAPGQSGGPDADREVVANLHRQRVPASADVLPVLRDELDQWARSAGLNDRVIDSLALASYEAMANAVEHAYDGAPGPLDVEAALREEAVEVTITDHGSWQTPSKSAAERRRGLPLIHRLADEAVVTSGEDGTRVLMRWDTARSDRGEPLPG